MDYVPLTPPHFPSFRHAYRSLARDVLGYGHEVAPRGERTRELLAASFVITNPFDTLATGVGRKLSVGFAASDALSVVGGFSDHDWASQWNRRIAEYGEHGAYGPRIAGQVQAAINRLSRDPSSRRAVVQVWDQHRDLRHREDATDYPCTTLFQLMIRSDAVDIHVSMRANDLWWGTAYDVFAFSQVQCTVANLLGLDVGFYYHHATSLHLYEKDWEAAGNLLALRPDDPPQHLVRGLGQRGESWGQVMQVANAIRRRLDPPRPLTAPEQWYWDRLAPKGA